MKILVTGAAGFIGSHTAERLKALGHQVVGLDNFSPYYDPQLKTLNAEALAAKNIPVLKVDLRRHTLSGELPADIDYIFHCAAHPGISASSTFSDYLENNVVGTQNLIAYALGLRRTPFVVNISTSSVYGLVATLPETAVPRPASWYGVTKLAAEQLVLAKIRMGLLRGTSLRLYSVYGPRERPDKLYTRLIDCALHHKAFPLFEGSEKHRRSFTFVQDIVDGIVSVLGKEAICNGEIFNLGSEAEKTTSQGITTVEEILNKKINIEKKPSRLGDQSRTQANIDKARKLLGYNPQTSLLVGVQAQIAWFRENFC